MTKYQNHLQRGPVTLLALVAFVSCHVPAVGQDASPAPSLNTTDETILHFPAANNVRMQQRELESSLVRTISRDRLRTLHEILGSEPHVAGTDGDVSASDAMALLFETLGLNVERHEFWPLLSTPVSASLDMVSPVELSLPIMEKKVEGDPYLDHPDLTFGWNAFSGNGTVTAEVVYANHGRKQDFERLRELGIDCAGKIVVARYGGNYRGYKAKFAEEAGAVGLIMYTDPGDSGFGRGEMYPDGGYANPTYIQRGSIKTLPYAGDPLTPFLEATKDADRLDAEALALPKIPVQPVGWAAAQEILSRMTGETAPEEWQGGLEFPYHLTGGSNLRVRLHVEQKREIKRVENIIATLPGDTYPEEKIIIGAHHDAWSFGAGDPLSGTICVFELARVFCEQANNGHWPDRSIVFACWGAEEYGIIGSTEWVEANADDLAKNAVAYLNLDMASMGLNFGSSAAPMLKQVIVDAMRHVPQATKNDAGRASVTDESVFQNWMKRNGWPEEDIDEPRLGTLGGGSDHVGFYCHLGVPSAGLSAGGSPGVSYHSNYDNLNWYRKIVGNDYESPALVTGVTAITAARLANAPVLPYDITRYATDTRSHLESVVSRFEGLDTDEQEQTDAAAARLNEAINAFEAQAKKTTEQLRSSTESIAADEAHQVNAILLGMEDRWIHDEGLPNRPWYRSLYVAPDEDSGYASWPLPALRRAVEDHDVGAFTSAIDLYVEVFKKLERDVLALHTILDG